MQDITTKPSHLHHWMGSVPKYLLCPHKRVKHLNMYKFLGINHIIKNGS